jgi:hypothetical protein
VCLKDKEKRREEKRERERERETKQYSLCVREVEDRK